MYRRTKFNRGDILEALVYDREGVLHCNYFFVIGIQDSKFGRDYKIAPVYKDETYHYPYRIDRQSYVDRIGISKGFYRLWRKINW